jgi:hypothetical protein
VDALGDHSSPVGGSTPADGFLRHRGLIALAVCGAAAEACLLSALGPAARPLAPQVTAVPPLAVFHDLRWLFGYNRSWRGFVLGFVILIVGRSAVCAALIRLAWPRGLPSPRWSATFGRCMIFTVIACLLLAPVATLLFGVALLPFSWPFLAALPAMLLIMMPLSHGGLLGSWWRTLPPARAVGWLLASFLMLTVASAVIASLPAAAAVAVAAVAGLGNARAWYGLAAAVTRREPQRHAWPAPVSPIAAATALALVIGMTRLVFVLAVHTPADLTPSASADVSHRPAAAAAGLTAAVLVVPGFGSSCCSPSAALRRIGPPALLQQFSYLGLDALGRPLPYGRGDTDVTLPVLGDRIAAQVWRLHRETGRPVDIVAESEGTLGVYAMLARHPNVPVAAVVLLSPIVDPGEAGHDPVGRDPGTDPVSSEALTTLVRVAGALSPFGESGAQQLITSVRRDGAAFAAAAAKDGRRLRWLAVIPLADALTLPACELPGNVIVVPALHGSLLGNAQVDDTVHRFLSHQRVSGPQQMRVTAEVIAAAAEAWRMPELGAAPPACTR